MRERVAARPEAMTEAEYEFRRQAYKLKRGAQYEPDADYLQRPLLITVFDGYYGPAGLVITINGSPSKLVLVVVGHAKRSSAVYALDQGGKATVICRSEFAPVARAKAPMVEALWALLAERGYITDYDGLRVPEPGQVSAQQAA